MDGRCHRRARPFPSANAEACDHSRQGTSPWMPLHLYVSVVHGELRPAETVVDDAGVSGAGQLCSAQ